MRRVTRIISLSAISFYILCTCEEREREREGILFLAEFSLILDLEKVPLDLKGKYSTRALVARCTGKKNTFENLFLGDGNLLTNMRTLFHRDIFCSS